MAVQPHPEPRTKLSGFVIRAGKKGYTHAPEQLWASSLPCLAFAWLNIRQVHQPAAASHTFRSPCAQERRCTLGKVWGTATRAGADNSAVLTHSGFTPESAAVTKGKKATYKPSGNGGAGGAEPKGTAAPMSCSKRRGLCTAERWALLLWTKPHDSIRKPPSLPVTSVGSLAAFSRNLVVVLFRAVTFQSA